MLFAFSLGTAGVWRILAINEAQGWKERENDRGGDGLNSQSNSPWLEVCVHWRPQGLCPHDQVKEVHARLKIEPTCRSHKLSHESPCWFARSRVSYQAITEPIVISSIDGPVDLQTCSRK